MQLDIILAKWSRTTGKLFIGGALAWALKLCVIVATNGRIIDTGASVFFMNTGLLMLIAGSTGIGSRLSLNHHLFLRIFSIILSPAIVFCSFFLFGLITNPIFQNTSTWYPRQEAPIGLAVLVYISVGYYLYDTPKRVYQ